jgi:hypothetical protein
VITTSETIKDLAAALAKAQPGYKAISKDHTAKAGPYSYEYADLAACMAATLPSLNTNGISIIQAPNADGNVVTVTSRLLHTSGQWIESSIQGVAENASAQKIGSMVTYLRRYSYLGLVGAIPGGEDDDGAAAMPPVGPPKVERAVRPPQPAKPAPPPPPAPSAVDRKNAALDGMEKMHGLGDMRAAMSRILGRTFPLSEEIALSLHEITKLEAHLKGGNP